jgi:hypothetical protein
MFWKKKKLAMPAMEPVTDPRPHHYAFVHNCMRVMCEEDTATFFSVMASPKQRDFIKTMWDMVCEACDAEATTELTADDIGVETLRIRDCPTILVHMPEPRGITEAHMVCIILTTPLEEDFDPDQMEFRYFTLEYGWAERGKTSPVLCEWTKDAHHNFGPGPEPETQAFLKVVEANVWPDG